MVGRRLFKRIHHIGVVVDDLEQADRFLSDTLGLPLVRSINVEGRRDRCRFFRCGETDIEVIEVTDPEERARRLGVGVSARIEHIALEVDHLDTAIGYLTASGVDASPSLKLGSTINAWTDPTTSDGVMYQLVQADDPREDPPSVLASERTRASGISQPLVSSAEAQPENAS